MSAPAVVAAPACARCAVHAESVFRVDGLCCGEEAAILQRRLTPLAGVEDINADIVGQRLRVTYDAAVLSTNTIVEAVAETGMRAWLEHEEPIVPASSRRARDGSCSHRRVAVGSGLLLQALRVTPDAWSIARFADRGHRGRRVSGEAGVGRRAPPRARHQHADDRGRDRRRVSSASGRKRVPSSCCLRLRSGSNRGAWSGRAKRFAR